MGVLNAKAWAVHFPTGSTSTAAGRQNNQDIAGRILSALTQNQDVPDDLKRFANGEEPGWQVVPAHRPDEQIENWFTYHPPASGDHPRFVAIRDAAKALAYVIKANTPGCADQTAALRKLRECVMTANAAIACGGR